MRRPAPLSVPLLVIAPLALAAVLGGCVSTATTIVKAPFAVGGKMVDLATTSPAEADRNYARKMRREEAREGRERRDWAKRCQRTPDDPDCRAYTGYRAGT